MPTSVGIHGGAWVLPRHALHAIYYCRDAGLAPPFFVPSLILFGSLPKLPKSKLAVRRTLPTYSVQYQSYTDIHDHQNPIGNLFAPSTLCFVASFRVSPFGTAMSKKPQQPDHEETTKRKRILSSFSRQFHSLFHPFIYNLKNNSLTLSPPVRHLTTRILLFGL